ncbi:hypothetical protein D9613_002225 [Agrocybe pediades]|uniref:Uncharacterized protein n=1 Tax=Agrocybe pediades TaxID=84607 RepID=A0A8H4VV60_9AGAR|nr:hypothetical protein D9613_002225 [Agrocybe pediades]
MATKNYMPDDEKLMLLLFHTFRAFHGTVAEASHLLCSAQAALINGTPTMSGVATFLVVFQIWRTFRDPLEQRVYRGRCGCSEKATLIILQIKFPDSLDRRNGLYCTIMGVPFRRWSVPMFSIALLLLMIVFESSIALRYYRARKRIVSSFPLAHRSTSRGLVIRISLFNLYLFVTFGASIVFVTGKAKAWPYMIQAGLPLVAFLLFASQKNILMAWCFWRKPSKERFSGDSAPPQPFNRTRSTETDVDLISPLATSHEQEERGSSTRVITLETSFRTGQRNLKGIEKPGVSIISIE